MSWDKYSRIREAACACGNGKVVMTEYLADDDWNRTRCDGKSFEIKCEECSKKYHVELITRRFFQPPWKGDGISTWYYLVPNGIELPRVITPRSFCSRSCKEEIAIQFGKQALIEALNDMRVNRYSTRLQQKESKEIVKIYHRRTGRRNLPDIILCLQEVVEEYSNYQWNQEKIAEYRIKEEAKIKENEDRIKAVINVSFELDL